MSLNVDKDGSAVIQLKGFLGEIPANNPHYLPDNNAQKAVNMRLWSGALRPISAPLSVASIKSATTPEAIFKYDSTHWFEWTVKAKAVRSPVANEAYGRVYFTRADTGIWVTDSTIGLTGVGPWPAAAVRPGIPAPLDAASPAAASGTATSGSVPESWFYVYTLTNAYGEEGPPSPVSPGVIISPGQTTVVTLPALSGAMTTALSAYKALATNPINLYRSNSTGSAYQLVATGKTWSGTFTDSFLYALQEDLATANFDPPPNELQGVIALPNGALAGYLNNEVYLSEIGLPHAWPYSYSFNSNVRGLGIVDGGIAIITDGKPYLLAGTSPGSMAPTPLEVPYSCLSTDGVVQFGTAVLYPSPFSFVAVAYNGAHEVTGQLFDIEDWHSINAATMRAFNWWNMYVGFYTTPDGVSKGIMFDPQKPESGVVEFFGMTIGGAYEDRGTGDVYVATGRDIALWNGGPPQQLQWKSKPYDMPRPMTMTCVQVLAEAYPVQIAVYRDGDLQCRTWVGSYRAARLANIERGVVYEVEINSVGEVREVNVSNSMAALQKL